VPSTSPRLPLPRPGAPADHVPGRDSGLVERRDPTRRVRGCAVAARSLIKVGVQTSPRNVCIPCAHARAPGAIMAVPLPVDASGALTRGALSILARILSAPGIGASAAPLVSSAGKNKKKTVQARGTPRHQASQWDWPNNAIGLAAAARAGAGRLVHDPIRSSDPSIVGPALPSYRRMVPPRQPGRGLTMAPQRRLPRASPRGRRISGAARPCQSADIGGARRCAGLAVATSLVRAPDTCVRVTLHDLKWGGRSGRRSDLRISSSQPRRPHQVRGRSRLCGLALKRPR